MTLQGAVIIEQGVTFAIVVVKPSVTMYTTRLVQMRNMLAPLFPHMPIILMSQDAAGTPHYYGRKDIVDFLKTVRLDQIPWKNYRLY